MKNEIKYTSVRLDNPYNGTLFNDCCGIAVSSEDSQCRRCGAVIEPENPRDRWTNAFHKKV